MKNKLIPHIKPQDIVILMKLISIDNKNVTQVELARELFMSQSEVSESLFRSQYSRLISKNKQDIAKEKLFNFLLYGLPIAFPQQPGEITRGIPTGHSAAPLNNDFENKEIYVWPYSKGNVRGQSILPLYPSVVEAALLDSKLYELLSLIDAIRVGYARERSLAKKYLQELLC